MELFAWIILAVILLDFVFEWVTELLNIRKASSKLPEDLKAFYDEKKYADSQKYLIENTRFNLIQTSVKTLVLILFLYSGALEYLTNWVFLSSGSYIWQGLLFFASIGLGLFLLSLPFSLYHTFSIETRFGFNTMSLKTFFGDTIKQLIVGCILGGLVLASLLWFFNATGEFAWVYCWGALTLFQLCILFVAPIWILPLFNKFIPLNEGELKSSIEEYAHAQNFSLKGIFTMDGSKRSNKSNAYFTGFGKMRRIVLFDTLVEKCSKDEILSILAHEMGHCRLKHVLKMVGLSFISSGVMLFLFSQLLNNSLLFTSFSLSHISIYTSLFFFFILYSPIQTVLSIFNLALSRKYEFEADAYAVTTIKKPMALVNALSKLSVDHLANLTPHRLKVLTAYSHPPISERLHAIKEIKI